MKGLRTLTHAAVVLACCGMMIPRQVAVAAAPSRPAVPDVAMSAGGKLTGAVVTRQGKSLDGAVVVISQVGEPIAKTTTDAKGVFAVAGLRGGVYQLHVGGQETTVRAWTAEAAPPAARTQAVLVTGEAVRGQDPFMGMDVITLWTLGASTGALIVAAINQSDINDLEDQLDDIEEKLDAMASP